ncbi:PilZ domain-containing protein [Pleionea sediminis]|uniref:PilZ domain-containing protein n=1 Tax=Pleionea sediminis TaxID=2569479 RepID=UPI001184A391|nr:PilZ domain-containing protein [Pleionea sediminis]
MTMNYDMERYDRRGSPRYDVDLPAEVITSDGQTFAVKIVNLSISGLQFEIINESIPLLMPNEDREFKIDTIPLLVKILLPKEASEVVIKLGIVYFRRVSMFDSVLGCRFETFYSQSASVLEQYIRKLDGNKELMADSMSPMYLV